MSQVLQRRTEEAKARRQASATEAVLATTAAAAAAASDNECLSADATSTSALLDATEAAEAEDSQSASGVWSPVAGLLSHMLPVLQGPTAVLLSLTLAVHTVRKTTAITNAWLHAYRPFVDCEHPSSRFHHLYEKSGCFPDMCLVVTDAWLHAYRTGHTLTVSNIVTKRADCMCCL